MAMTEDLSAFFGTDDFAVDVVRQRSGVEDLEFQGIPGAVDEEAMQGYTVMATASLLFPAITDVREGDTLLIDGQPAVVLAPPRRQGDGALTVVYLRGG